MSGTSLMIKPLPLPVSEFVYASIMQALGLEGLSGSERVKALLEVPSEKLVALPPNLPLLPIIDNTLITDVVMFSQISSKSEILALPGRKWCDDLLIGDCQFDVSSIPTSPSTVKIGRGQSYHTCWAHGQSILPKASVTP
jgi:hypothetical protein